jgi:hypothetical protein
MARYCSSSNNLTCGDISAMEGLTNFSMGITFKRAVSSANMGFSKFSTSTNATFIQGFTDGNIYFSIRNGQGNFAYFARNVLTWDRVLLTFDGALVGNLKLKGYLNGVEQSLTYSGTLPVTTASNAASLMIGKVNAANSNGDFAEARIWDKTLNSGEIFQDTYGRYPAQNLIGYWPCGYGDPDPDYSGAGNNATLVNTPTVVDHPPIVPQFGSDLDYSPYTVASASGHGGLLSTQRNRLVYGG